jgi:NAD-dependent SIR2 family protein deacetylase
VPNAAHQALRDSRDGGRSRTVTQNVDGLHQLAGSAKIIELHGNLSRVICRDCGTDHARVAIQRTLERNPGSGDRATRLRRRFD